MSLGKHPFQRYTEDHEFEKADIISCRMNRDERVMLEFAKSDLKVKADSTVLKILLSEKYHYVIHVEKLVNELLAHKLSKHNISLDMGDKGVENA